MRSRCCCHWLGLGMVVGCKSLGQPLWHWCDVGDSCHPLLLVDGPRLKAVAERCSGHPILELGDGPRPSSKGPHVVGLVAGSLGSV